MRPSIAPAVWTFSCWNASKATLLKEKKTNYTTDGQVPIMDLHWQYTLPQLRSYLLLWRFPGSWWSVKYLGRTWKVLKGSINAPASILMSECEREWHRHLQSLGREPESGKFNLQLFLLGGTTIAVGQEQLS